MIRTLGVVIAALLSGPLAARAQTTFSDGDFDPANWDFVQVEREEGGDISSRVTSAGNPGNAFEVELSLEAAAGFSLVMGLWFWHEPYDPAVQGGFASIEYSEDAIYIAPGSGNGHATGPALRQNGSVFWHRVDFTPNQTWTPITGCGIGPGDFARILGSGSLDFSASGAPIEVGFYRAISHAPFGGGAGFRTGAIDNWSVTLVPACSSDADCGGADGCTANVCVDSVCECAPVECDDGSICTFDSCIDGVCQFLPSIDLATVEAKLQEARGSLDGSPCDQEELVRRLKKKLAKKLKKALKRLARTDDVTRERALRRLFQKADNLLAKAQSLITRAVDAGLISPACGTTLQGIVAELQLCANGLPRPVS